MAVDAGARARSADVWRAAEAFLRLAGSSTTARHTELAHSQTFAHMVRLKRQVRIRFESRNGVRARAMGRATAGTRSQVRVSLRVSSRVSIIVTLL